MTSFTGTIFVGFDGDNEDKMEDGGEEQGDASPVKMFATLMLLPLTFFETLLPIVAELRHCGTVVSMDSFVVLEVVLVPLGAVFGNISKRKYILPLLINKKNHPKYEPCICLDLISSFDLFRWLLESLSLVPDDVFMVLFLIDTINLGTLGGAELTTLNDVSDGNFGVVNPVKEVLPGIFSFRRTFLSSSVR